jgi:hypothetical protein
MNDRAKRLWRVTEREAGKPVAWEVTFGPLTLLLRWHVVEKGSREWWILFMLPEHPFGGYVSGDDEHPEREYYEPNLKRRDEDEAKRLAIEYAKKRLKPYARAYKSIEQVMEVQ